MESEIAIVYPHVGGIDIYARYLCKTLRELGLNIQELSLPQHTSPYDPKTQRFRRLSNYLPDLYSSIDQLQLERFKIVLYHFGKNDPEQLIPLRLIQTNNCPHLSLYFAHYLSWNLFSDYFGDNALQDDIRSSIISQMDYYVWFGEHAKAYFTTEHNTNPKLGIVSYLPATHPDNPAPVSPTIQKVLHRFDTSSDLPMLILPGYAAHYKDHELLIDALEILETPIRFLFVGKGWSKRVKFSSKICNKVNVRIEDTVISRSDFYHLCKLSCIGIFPYRQTSGMKTEVFQGSGTLPNFLGIGKRCVVLEQGCLGEYNEGLGPVVQNGDPSLLAKSIEDTLAVSSIPYDEQQKLRLCRFDMSYHAREVYSFVDRILASL